VQQLKVILNNIENGQYIYQPEQDDFESLKSFQDTAKRLMFAKEEGYIFDLKHQVDHRNPGGLVRNLLVKGGLTLKGEQFLLSPQEEVQIKEPEEDIIDIKPNIAGIGINFNAAYRWVKRKIKN
jgi:hypothetical protein